MPAAKPMRAPTERYAKSCRDHVKGDGGGRRRVMKRNRAVPHIGREQHKPSRNRLNGAAEGQSDIDVRLAELDPALFGLCVFHGLGQSGVVARTDPAHVMDMVGMKAAIAKPRRPGTG